MRQIFYQEARKPGEEFECCRFEGPRIFSLSCFPAFLMKTILIHFVVAVMLAVGVSPAWAQRGRKEEPPAEPSYTLGYSLALLAAGAALFVVGRPHARVRESGTGEQDQV